MHCFLRLLVLAAPALSACGRDPAPARPDRAGPETAARDSAAAPDTVPAIQPWEPRPLVVEPPAAPAESVASHPGSADSAAIQPDSTRPGSGGPADSAAQRPAGRRKPTAGQRRAFALPPADSARWPVKGPAPLPGALLPEHRIIAFYGNPKSTRMGILGQLPPAEMLPKLERTALEWAKADPGHKTLPALHLIATVAQDKPGPGGTYRLRHSDQLIEQVLGWAEERGWVVFLDVQIGQSTVPNELPHLVKYLERPYVHLALDPEFAMKLGGVPGRRIGTLDATDLNYAIRLLAGIVDRKQLPPKILVVHRFTQRMLTNHDQVKLDPRVQVVVDMDGFGAPWLKEDAYKFFIVPEPIEYAGFKLFYKNDKPMMTPAQVLKLWPVPVYIQYQ
jgi:hypothetical protein